MKLATKTTKIYTQVSFERTRRIAELSSLPGAVNNPVRNSSKNQPPSKGRNFQK